MDTQVALFEPIKAPDPRRPATLPSLPVWAERSSAAARTDLQLSQDGTKFEDALILPRAMLPTDEQRREIIDHLDSLRLYLRQTPAHDVMAETRAATAVTKLIVVLAGEKKSDLSNDARNEVYLDVLEDVPCWAVEAAVKAWFRHDCGSDERGKPHDYKWAPDPGTLRVIAQQQAFAVSARIGKLQRVLDAREYVDCSRQLQAGVDAMKGLNKALKTGNMDSVRALSFDSAIELGQAVDVPPAQAPAPAADLPADQPAREMVG